MAFDPYEVLGVPRGSTQDEIKQAYHKKAKAAHPDIHGDGSAEEFIRVQEAYEKLRARAGVRVREGLDDDHGFDSSEGLDPIEFVRGFMEQFGIEILFNGGMSIRGAPRMASTRADIDGYLERHEADDQWLIDNVMLSIKRQSIKLSKEDIERALRMVTREDQKARRNMVMKPLLKAVLSEEERARAEQEWQRLVEGAFEGNVQLNASILKKFIYQVKRKTLGLPIKRHLMPVLQSLIQGIGKTTFVLNFLGPLKELATDPALLSDFIDRRSGDIYQYPVIFIDDMEKIEPKQIPILNSLITGEGLTRRTMRTSRVRHLTQRATLISTANKEVAELIADETGNRRIATMHLRNGEVGKGGDPKVWQIIGSTDFELLWTSVDAFGPDPIEPFLDDLFALQEATRKFEDLEAWLLELDLASEEVRAISTPKGVKAAKLRDLFNAQTGNSMTMSAFGKKMLAYFAKPRMPFKAKVNDPVGTLYVAG